MDKGGDNGDNFQICPRAKRAAANLRILNGAPLGRGEAKNLLIRRDENNRMFIGEYAHTIDAKKRLAIPAKFRKELGTRAVITRGLDACLFVYPVRAWEGLVEKLGGLPVGQSGTRSFVRLILAGAADVELDALGRILIPDYLKTYAGIAKQVIVAGIGGRIEVWDGKRWEEYKVKTEQSTDEIAERLGELGVY